MTKVSPTLKKNRSAIVNNVSCEANFKGSIILLSIHVFFRDCGHCNKLVKTETFNNYSNTLVETNKCAERAQSMIFYFLSQNNNGDEHWELTKVNENGILKSGRLKLESEIS